MRRKQRGLQFYRKKKGLSMQAVKEVFSWIVLSVLAVFLAFMVIWAVGLRTNMIGVSMEPGLTNGQGILVNRLKYRFFSPQTGDVVVFLPSEDSRSANVGPVLRSTIVGEAWFHFGNGTDGWGLIH